jgi:DNA polymerase-1
MTRTLWEYNCLDCVTTAQVYRKINTELATLGVDAFYHTMVQPLILAVKRMGARGMWLDRDKLEEMRTEYEIKIGKFEDAIKLIVNDPEFNPNSTAHVRDYVYNRLGIGVASRTATGAASVDETTLLKLGAKYDHAFFKALLGYRKVVKYYGTYLKRIYIGPDSRVRSRFLVHGTATGRLSSREPNFQNIPYDLRPIYGADNGRLLIEVDSSQLELRLIAYASGCRRLISGFEAGEDVHRLNAAAIYGIAVDAVGKEERDFAKRFVYCQNYGGGPKKISEILFADAGITKSPRECEEMLYRLRAAYPEIWTWRDKVLAECKRTRTIRNEYGRVRITFARDEALSGIAYNTPIQSTAADYINTVFLELNNAGLCIVNQVHDSILVESTASMLDDTVQQMLTAFERPQRLWGRLVVLPAEAKVGTRWGLLEKW